MTEKMLAVDTHHARNGRFEKQGWLLRERVPGNWNIGNISDTAKHFRRGGGHMRRLSDDTLTTWLRNVKTKFHSLLSVEEAKGRDLATLERVYNEAVEAALSDKRPGKMSPVSNTLHVRVSQFIMEQVDAGVPNLNSATLQGPIIALIKQLSPGLIEGREFTCSRSWIKKVVRKMDLRRRAATTAAQKLPDNHEEVLHTWRLQIAHTIGTKNIPPELVINVDQTGCHLVPVSKHTLGKRGAKAIRAVGVDDKRQVTVVVAGAADGTLLPWQVIFTGKAESDDQDLVHGDLHAVLQARQGGAGAGARPPVHSHGGLLEDPHAEGVH
jgi:alkylated DNA nucleotide flippase Atl1